MEYAIVDIETTGGYASASGITDIAIVIHDGKKVIDRYGTLVNPGMHIPVYIEALTGINDDMVAGAPAFGEIAGEVYAWLQGRVFVAHNVNFDFSFVQHYLSLSGFDLKVPKLCTVRMGRKIRPGFPSYSLGKLCDSLGIPVVDRHRAGGDADATAILFGKLLAWDTEGIVPGMLHRGTKEQVLPPHLPKGEFDALPHGPGVYYFLDSKGKPIYIGKAVDLKKRVAQHFTGNNTGPQRQGFLKEIYHVTFEPCATEIMALLLEAAEIKQRWPRYNRALKKYEPRFGLLAYHDQHGFKRLMVGKLKKGQSSLQGFCTEEKGRNLLHRLLHDFVLCPMRCMLGKCGPINGCYSCGDMAEDPGSYNSRVDDALAHLTDYLPSYYITDRGRHKDEKSVIYIEKGQFYGMGYIGTDCVLKDVEEIKGLLTRYHSWEYMVHMVDTYAWKYPLLVNALPGVTQRHLQKRATEGDAMLKKNVNHEMAEDFIAPSLQIR